MHRFEATVVQLMSIRARYFSGIASVIQRTWDVSTFATLTLAGGPVGSGGGGGAAGAGDAGCCCAAAAGLADMKAPAPPRPDENAGGLVGATLGMNAAGAAFCGDNGSHISSWVVMGCSRAIKTLSHVNYLSPTQVFDSRLTVRV